MITILAYRATIKLIVNDTKTEYEINHHWSKEGNWQGKSGYYETEHKLPSTVVEQIFEQYIEDQEAESFWITQTELDNLCTT